MDTARIADRIAISETKARYCRTLDTRDWDGFADVFTEDLDLDTTPAGGYRVQGRDAALERIRASLAGATTVHQVHAPEMRFDGDTAEVIWAMQDRVVFGAEATSRTGIIGLTGYGHYHEHYRRCADGRWRIARQRLTRLHVDFERAPSSG